MPKLIYTLIGIFNNGKLPHQMNTKYDVIVIGVGSMGSATCYYLAKSGLKVLGLEQFNLPHENGSHTGESRFVRMAYFEDPDYVPLLKRAYKNWEHLEDVSGKKFFHKTGIVYFGEVDSVQTSGVRKSSQLYNLPIETVSKDDRRQRFSLFNIPKSYECLFEADAGFVQPELTIEAYVALAREQGADIKEQEKLLTWEYENGTVKCTTDKGSYTAKKLIFTSGAWTQQLLPQLAGTLQATQQALLWYRPKHPDQFGEDRFSCWSITDPAYDGMFYGFPIVDRDDPTFKIAYHAHGIDIRPELKAQQASSKEIEPLHFFLKRYMPDLAGEIAYTKTCLYTYSPDEDFIIDFLPEHDQAVIVACGFSGHGFKFVPMVGELLKDLAVTGSTELPIEFLGLR